MAARVIQVLCFLGLGAAAFAALVGGYWLVNEIFTITPLFAD